MTLPAWNYAGDGDILQSRCLLLSGIVVLFGNAKRATKISKTLMNSETFRVHK